MSFTSLFVQDLEREASFYEQAFGLTPLDHLRSPIFRAYDVGGGHAFGLHAPDAYDLLGLADHAANEGVRTVISFDPGSVDAVDDNVERVVAAGATLVKGPFDTYYNARQVVFFDPEGHTVRLSHQRA